MTFLSEVVMAKVALISKDKALAELGDESFINRIENAANRVLRKKKPGPKQEK
jgi:hypothetical protein